MSIKIRKLDSEDYDQIIELWADAGLPYKPNGRDSKEMLSKEISLPHCAFFGLFDDDKMLAVGIANFDGRRGWVNRVAVDPDRRGKNYAGMIIKKCEEFLKDQGSVVLCALIEDVNMPSISCFQKNGYTCEGEIEYFTKRDSADS